MASYDEVYSDGFMEEIRKLDEAYCESEKRDAEAYAAWLAERLAQDPDFDPEEEEGPDPIRDGWVGSDGRP